MGYTQSEFLVSGTAASYTAAVPLGSDGRWQAEPATTAPYTTRIVVYRPADAARFNGTVVVEWLNVSAGADAGAEWIFSHTELIREGYAWVGVSAQAAGANNTKSLDPARYAAVSHPGDSYSYDIFSQAGQAVRDSAAKVLGGLEPRRVLGEGESQSGFRLATYINAVHPLVNVYDGYFVHSRGGRGAPLSEPPQQIVLPPSVVRSRTDLDVPVLSLETETDVMFGSLGARQDDTARFRLWELAGTAHADSYITIVGRGDTGTRETALRELNLMLDPPTELGEAGSCTSPINTGQQHYVLNTAQYWLNRWVATGQAPPRAPRLQVDTSGLLPAFVLDAHGNVKGGLRTPAVDAPVATLSGLGQTGSVFCFLFGTTTPFGAAKLATLYPTRAHFVARWSAATASGVAAGFVRPADAALLVAAARASEIGGRPAE
ncbi:hypothetical protein DPM19_22835 [Actinomadura craniellae]|uniref:Alpha/beta hydrolase domain-containing protein n=1 Tax=Actinomadura craniellae TaxID=2231787 RepID=A0A365H1K1_9ACTN|nr:hypothetical protein DPM19_22835 [Actinomadura craniellae]